MNTRYTDAMSLPQETNWVEEALKHAAEPEAPDGEKIAQLTKKRNALQKTRRNCLPVEGQLITKIDEDLAQLDKELEEEKSKEGSVNHPLSKKYKLIDLSIPLSWTHTDTFIRENRGCPRLATFTLKKSSTTFRVSDDNYEGLWGFGIFLGFLTAFLGPIWLSLYMSWPFAIGTSLLSGTVTFFLMGLLADHLQKRARNGTISPRLPKEIREHYGPALKSIRGNRYMLGREATATFRGSIPPEVREEIKKAKKDFGKKIYLIAEENNWESRDIAPVNLDPLVIGVKDGRTWLITSFDLTPIEDAVQSEWSY